MPVTAAGKRAKAGAAALLVATFLLLGDLTVRHLQAHYEMQEALIPVRTPPGSWGYQNSSGSTVIAPTFVGAGKFRNGRAPVRDSSGYAFIDTAGRIVERIATDSVGPASNPVPPPALVCTTKDSTVMPSRGLRCFTEMLLDTAAAAGGEVMINPRRGEGFHAAFVWKMPTGVVSVEEHGNEGMRRRLLLPGVTAAQALDWRRMIQHERPGPGCEDRWTSGAITGGAFIEQRAGC